jgi:Flp pilus assembly protein TadG
MPRHSRGQATLEFALVVPVIALLVFGGLNVTILIGDDLKAGYAVGAGVRYAAELGGRQSNPTATTAQIDAAIVSDVLTVMHGTSYVTLDEVDIYAVSSADGSMQPGDPADTFDGTGRPLARQTFPLELRLQSPPDDTSMGVRLRWHYTLPLLNLGTAATTTYAVMRCEPITS